MNEGAKFSPVVWQKAIFPALADRNGWSLWPTTPEGLNYFYELHQGASDPQAMSHESARWQEPSTANPRFNPKKIEEARRQGVSELMIRQEFFAEFIVMGAGRTYYEFDRPTHVQEHGYDPALPIDLCFSFGIAPPACLVTQGTRGVGLECVIDEIGADNSSPALRDLLTEFRRKYPNHAHGHNVRVYGDIGGYSDFEALRALLPRAKHFTGGTVAEKDCTNAVNTMLRDGRGQVRAYVNPTCEKLIRDLEGTRNNEASFRVSHREIGMGHYAAAWAAKLTDEYPALLETLRSSRDPGIPREGRFGHLQSTPEARACYSAYWTAVRAGKLVRPSACEQCGAVGQVQADHRDYSKPLDVTHLCAPCHSRMPPAGGTLASSLRH
jgi:hypothetical protein